MTDSQRILDSIRRLVRLLRLSDRAAQTEVGLSGAQLFVLQELFRSPSLSLNELAERTRTDQSSVSVVVTRLVESGLVTRDRDARDARRLVLNLTKAGRSAVQKAPGVAQERIIEIVEKMAVPDRRRFAEAFETLVSELGAESGAAPMLFVEDDEPRRRLRKIK